MGWEPFEPYAVALRDQAARLVQDERGVRVEDYLALLAAATGEAAVVASGVIDVEHTDLVPGAGLFGDAINEVLTGDGTEVADVPAGSVVGVLRDRLVPGVVPLDAFGSLEDLYRHVAASVGVAPWGDVVVTVPADHRHDVLPLRAAFELRPVVQAVMDGVDGGVASGVLVRPPGWGPHQLCALALASAIDQTVGAIDVRIGVRLALEITFGMAKVVPMSVTAMEQAAREQAAGPQDGAGPA